MQKVKINGLGKYMGAYNGNFETNYSVIYQPSFTQLACKVLYTLP